MKNLIYLLFGVFLISSCAQEEAQHSYSPQIDLRAKVSVCHITGSGNWHVINVSENALLAHLGHGDVLLEDNDGDGWVVELNECVPGGDCNDDNSDINPGAAEICDDGIDNNCDGAVDCEDGTCSDDDACLCPCFTLGDILANDNVRYFDTQNGSTCLFDGTGFQETNGCLYGVAYQRFFCVAPNGCSVSGVITPQEKSACQRIVQQAIATLALPEVCTGNLRSNNSSDNGPFQLEAESSN